MTRPFSVSTVAYSGYPIEQALDSLARINIENIELALIQGAVYDLTEETLSEEYVCHIRTLLNQKGIRCTSLAAHCDMNLSNCNELLSKRVRLTQLLNCPRLIIYAPRDGSLAQFQQAASDAIGLAARAGIKILIENVGDTLPYVLNDAEDFEAVSRALTSEVMGINFDPGNLASHRPDSDLLFNTLESAAHAEHIHIKDLRLSGDRYEFCAVGEGVCRYPEFFRLSADGDIPFYSLELPFALIRRTCGKAELKPIEERLPIEEIEKRILISVSACRPEATVIGKETAIDKTSVIDKTTVIEKSA